MEILEAANPSRQDTPETRRFEDQPLAFHQQSGAYQELVRQDPLTGHRGRGPTPEGLEKGQPGQESKRTGPTCQAQGRIADGYNPGADLNRGLQN